MEWPVHQSHPVRYLYLGLLAGVGCTEETQSVSHFLKCIINTRNAVTSDTIYHVTAEWIPHMHL